MRNECTCQGPVECRPGALDNVRRINETLSSAPLQSECSQNAALSIPGESGGGAYARGRARYPARPPEGRAWTAEELCIRGKIVCNKDDAITTLP